MSRSLFVLYLAGVTLTLTAPMAMALDRGRDQNRDRDRLSDRRDDDRDYYSREDREREMGRLRAEMSRWDSELADLKRNHADRIARLRPGTREYQDEMRRFEDRQEEINLRKHRIGKELEYLEGKAPQPERQFETFRGGRHSDLSDEQLRDRLRYADWLIDHEQKKHERAMNTLQKENAPREQVEREKSRHERRVADYRKYYEELKNEASRRRDRR